MTNGTLAKIATFVIGLWILSSVVLSDTAGSIFHTLLLLVVIALLLYFMKREGIFENIF